MFTDISKDDCRHVCMLTREPKFHDLPPTAGHWRYLLSRIRELMLPCEWHHGSFHCLRSRKSLQLERDRQLELGYWLVWHPYSAMKFYWDCFMVSFSYIILMYIPVQVFYVCPTRYDPVILTSDAITFLDILSKFITGHSHEDGRKVTLEPKNIARLYLKGMFIPDVLSALPLQCISVFEENCQFPTHTIWFVFKLFRLSSMGKQWQNISKQIGITYAAAVVITVVFRIIIFFHWMTYTMFQIPAFFAHYYDNNEKITDWLRRVLLISDSPISVTAKYRWNLFNVFGLCNGGLHSYAYLIPELIFNSVVGIIGLVFLTYSVATLLCLAIYGRLEVLLFNGRLKQLTNYMIFKRLPKTLQQKIQLFINYKFYEHYFNEEAILNTIDEQIKQDINMHCCKRLVMNVPLFQDMPIALINTIVFSLTQVLYMPGETIVRCDQPGQSIYLIYSGTVTVINSAGKEVTHFRDGAYFGESALLHPGAIRSATIVALEITEIFKLSTKDFQACLQPYPHLKRRLQEHSFKPRRVGRRRHVML